MAGAQSQSDKDFTAKILRYAILSILIGYSNFSTYPGLFLFTYFRSFQAKILEKEP